MPSPLMETLDKAAFGSEPYRISPTETSLIMSAEQWLMTNGWEPHYIRGWTNVGRAFGAMDGHNGLWIRDRRHGFWDGSGERHPVRSVVTALNVLVDVDILPARFSTHGMKALADFAEALERAAVEIDGGDTSPSHRADLGTAWYVRADAYRAAAEVAREYDPIAVLS